MPDWILLLPIFFPLIGVPVIARIAPRVFARLRSLLWIIFIIFEIIAVAINIAPSSHHLLVSTWNLASFSIALQLDGVTLLVLLTMLVPLLALELITAPRSVIDSFSARILTSAILLGMSDNAVTMYCAWSLLDLSIFAWRLARNIEREHAARGLIIGLLSGFILFAGTLALNAGMTTEGAALLAIALWARLGLYPFHYLLPTRGAEVNEFWIARGVPMLAASNLWLHWSILGADAPVTLIGTLAIIALVVAFIQSIHQVDPARIAYAGMVSAIALVPLTMAVAGNANVVIGLWLTLAVFTALALFEMALRWRADDLNRFPRLLWFAGLLTLAGLPLTPAFLGRLGAYVALWKTNNGVVILVAGIATLFFLAPVWNIGYAVKGSESREPKRIEYAGLFMMTLAYVTLALLTPFITPLLGRAVGESYERAIDLVVRTDDVAGVGLSTVTLIVPVIVAFFIGERVRRMRPRSGDWIQLIGQWLDLEWIEKLITTVGTRAGAIARNTMSIAEENPTVWILFIALWIAIFVKMTR